MNTTISPSVAQGLTEFDYDAAHAALAVPALSALGSLAAELYKLTEEDAAEVRQDSDLSLPWPEGSRLRRSLDYVDSDTLACLARAVYYAGHWRSTRAAEIEPFPMPPTGASWKLSTYCDQALRSRLGLPRRSSSVQGLSFQVHEGVIRACYSSTEEWRWEEIGLAIPEVLQAAREVAKRYDLSGITRQQARRYKDNGKADDLQTGAVAFSDLIDAMRAEASKAAPARQDAPAWAALRWDTSPFMVPAGTWNRSDHARRSAKQDAKHADHAADLRRVVEAIRSDLGLPEDDAERAVFHLILGMGVSRAYLAQAGIPYEGRVLWDTDPER